MQPTRRGVEPSVQIVLEEIRQSGLVTEKNSFGAQGSGSAGPGGGSSSPGGGATTSSGVPKVKDPKQAQKQVGASVQNVISATAAQQAKAMGKPDPAVAAKQPYEPPKTPQERQRDADVQQDVSDLDKDKDGTLDPSEVPKAGQKVPVKKATPGGPGSMTEAALDDIFAEKPKRFICVNEDYEDQFGRFFTEDELTTHFKMKSPDYEITFGDWKEKHFCRVDESSEEVSKLITEDRKVTRAEAIRYGWTPPKKEKEKKKKKEVTEAESIKQRKMREPEPFEDPTKDEIKKKKALISANPKGAGVISSSGGGGSAGASECVRTEAQRDETLDKVFG